MDNGVLIALTFAGAIVALAILLSLMMHKRGRTRQDRNASRRDSAASATWIGVRQARNSGDDED